nr:hypothetical protein [Delftia tsuruhatensis]
MTAAAVAASDVAKSGVSWAAVLAGALGAAALSLLLFILGTGLGLSSVSVWTGQGLDAGAIGWTAVAWIAFAQLASAGVGGYLAGRLRSRWQGVHTDEVYFRDTAHGFLAWALATLLMVALMASAAGSALSGAFKVADTVAATASNVAGGVAGAAAPVATVDAGSPSPNPLGYWTHSLFRGSTGDTDARDAREAGVIFAHALRTGQLPDADALYLSQLVARNTSMSQEEAQQKVKSSFASLQQQVQQAEQKVQEVKEKSRQAAEQARKATAHSMLWLFVALMLGAFVGSLCATWGGRSRDRM